MKPKNELLFYRVVRILFVLLCARLFPRAGRLVGELFLLDSAGWVLQLARYGVPLLLTVAVMLMLSRTISMRDIGFNLNLGLWSLGAGAIGALVAAALAVALTLLSGPTVLGGPAEGAVLLTVKPLSQELLYRALVIGMLHPVFAVMRPFLGKGISAAGLISALIFAVSTVSIELIPFSVNLGDPLYQIALLLLGLWYAVMFEYTHSLLGPVITSAGFQGSLMLAAYLL